MQKLLTFFSAKMLGYIRSFNDTLTNDIVSFEQLGPGRVANNADPPFRASDPEVIKLFFFSCSIQLSLKFSRLINMKMP